MRKLIHPARLLRRLQRHPGFSALLCGVFMLLVGYWLLPIHGQVLITTNASDRPPGVWPQIWTDAPAVRLHDLVTIYVRDNTPWSYVKLVSDGVDAPRDISYGTGAGPWTWRWTTRAPDTPSFTIVFYHSCNTGCIERGRVVIGATTSAEAAATPAPRPTKLGVVFADPARDWHGRSGWTVELTYVQRQDDVLPPQN